MIVTIDGPTASGKSSAARLLAQHLGAVYIYSGLIYRGIAYLLGNELGYDTNSITCAEPRHVDWCLRELQYTYSSQSGAQLFTSSTNITPYLKSERTDALASCVSTNQYVRDGVYHVQHRLAQHDHVVVDGRDAGTVVFPHADVKFYLTAAAYVRVLRWRDDQRRRGMRCSLSESIYALRERDYRDAHRSNQPMRAASDAYHVDNSQLTLTQTVRLLKLVIRYHQ